MPEETQQEGVKEPVRIIDKREERRAEAEARRQAKEAELAAAAEQEAELQRQVDEIRAAADRGEITEEQKQQLLDAQARLIGLAQQQEVAGPKVSTAFVIYTRFDGSASVATNIEDLKMEDLHHPSNPNEVYAALAFVQMDMQAQQAANHVRNSMMNAAMEMQGMPAVPMATNGQQPPV